VLTADLDRELGVSLRALIAAGELPAAAASARTQGTWRPGPDGAPAEYATALPFELAALAGGEPAVIAAAFARPLGAAASIQSVDAAGGYLSITVTRQALGRAAVELAAAGPACASSTILAGTTGTVTPWPDVATASSWQQAWHEQAAAMTAHLASAAGASMTSSPGRERGASPSRRSEGARRPLAVAAAYFGADLVRYALARTPPQADLPPAWLRTLGPRGAAPSHNVGHPRAASTGGSGSWPVSAAGSGSMARPGWAGPPPGRPDPLAVVQQAHAAAASTLRWAAELGSDANSRLPSKAEAKPGERGQAVGHRIDADRLGGLLAEPAERALLTLLTFLPIRVAAAARRRRADELPGYLENVSAAWRTCRLAAPALPFSGRAAPRDAELAAARLVLADAVRTVLATGLALTGIAAIDRF